MTRSLAPRLRKQAKQGDFDIKVARTVLCMCRSKALKVPGGVTSFSLYNPLYVPVKI